ncbi:MAG: MATE family efflux transporter [Eubacteriales bacterium]|nr:MATE family efflux transporter [Eubacteriales bacterium]
MKRNDPATRREQMLTAPMHRLIPSVALPSIISMLVGAVYNMVDTFFVGKLGNSATGAVGIVFPIIGLLQALSFVFAHGASSRISRLLGSEQTEEASRTASTALVCAMLLGAVYGLFGILFRAPVMRLFGATETILPYAIDYGVYIFLAAPFFAASYVLNNTLRAEGSATLALIGMSLGAVLNILLDPIFIFAFGLGTAGAGIATAIGQLTSFLLLLYFYKSKRGFSALSIKLSYITPKWEMLYELVRVGAPSFLRSGLNSTASILLNNAAKGYGDAAVAAFSVVSRIMFLVFSTLVGYGQGFQPICGYNYGAGRHDRVYRSYGFTLLSGVGVMTFFGVLLIVFAEPMVGLFRNDPAVIAIGVNTLRAQAAALPLLGVIMLTNGLFMAIARPVPAALLALMRQGVCFIPLLYLLLHLYGVGGLEWTQAASDGLTFLLCLPLFCTTLMRLRRAALTYQAEQKPQEK